MHVIFDAANVVERSLLAADDAAHVWVEPLSDGLINPRRAMPGAENDVEQNLRVGAGHEVCLPGISAVPPGRKNH